MSAGPTKDGTRVSDDGFGPGISEFSSHPENDVDVAPPTRDALFIIPTRRRDGFKAGIRGHMLDLADPTDDRLAPSPDDLLIASIASRLAWSAQRFLRAHGLPDYVSVSAKWQRDLPSLADINLTITVSRPAEAVSAALAAALDNSLPARSLVRLVVDISLDE